MVRVQAPGRMAFDPKRRRGRKTKGRDGQIGWMTRLVPAFLVIQPSTPVECEMERRGKGSHG